jgi:uncharacterized protein (TIGR02466 family)
MNLEVTHLFVIPVVKAGLSYTFQEYEIDYINNKLEKTENEGNMRSVETNILEHKELENVKKFIEIGIKKYVEHIISPINENLEFYVTQSWINYTNTGGFHHRHAHPNSLISGCLYLNADKDTDTITFYNPYSQYKRISIPSKQMSSYNAHTSCMSIETGQLIMFDSSTEHMVEKTKSTKTRVSISFNVFVKGKLGTGFGDELKIL